MTPTKNPNKNSAAYLREYIKILQQRNKANARRLRNLVLTSNEITPKEAGAFFDLVIEMEESK